MGSHDLILESYKLLIAHFLEIAPLISSLNHFLQAQLVVRLSNFAKHSRMRLLDFTEVLQNLVVIKRNILSQNERPALNLNQINVVNGIPSVISIFKSIENN